MAEQAAKRVIELSEREEQARLRARNDWSMRLNLKKIGR